MNTPPTFYLRLLGSPSIEADGGAAALTGQVAQRHRLALLALLAMAPGQRLSRDKLLAYLWPDSDLERGRNLLKVSSYVLRTTLGEAALLSEGDDLRLNADLVRADAAEFEAALGRSDYAHAVALYKSPFLDGFFLSDAPDFEQWAARERDRLSLAYAKALEALAERAAGDRDFAKAVEWWKVRAAQDPYDSRVALRLMRALEASGNRAGALQHASIHQRLLQEEFGIAPAPEIIALVALVLVVAAVWRGWPSTSQAERSIAVLPFIDLSQSGDNEAFNDGLTEEIIAGLSGVPELKVISRTSVMHIDGQHAELRHLESGQLRRLHPRSLGHTVIRLVAVAERLGERGDEIGFRGFGVLDLQRRILLPQNR